MAFAAVSASHPHHPPAVRCPVARSGLLGAALAAVVAAAAMVIVAWWFSGAPAGAPAPIVIGLVLWSSTAALATLAWLRSPRGAIEWDGAQWWWSAAGAALPVACQAPPTVHLDIQGFLLVSACPAGCRLWLALERRQAPQQWLAFRRAVYSRARSAGDAAAASPSAPDGGRSPSSHP
ncbi:hypothetical protein [Acidovorax sp. FG27]|uniref:hypothetical protein n=1 Tax=Acidovorax sp. FG27 TaxID=3133652 RepID=UPI0030E91DE4